MGTREILKSIKEGNDLESYQNQLLDFHKENSRTIVILDDDPTGTQTVQNVPVITSWEEAILEKEIIRSSVFFILTNSRSLQINAADALALSIGKRLNKLAEKHNKQLILISRGDSTLRGHYPNEVNALVTGLGIPNAKQLLAPAFFDGGRFTYHDIHWVQEGEDFIPAADTNFAQDATFGYTSSNLQDWIVEKSNGTIDKSAILSLSVAEIRTKNTAEIAAKIDTSNKTHIVSNATADTDLQKVALACLQSQSQFVYRTAASFVNAITGISRAGLLSKNQLTEFKNEHGALIVIGSYVTKSTEQFNYLKDNSSAIFIELNVDSIFGTVDLESKIFEISQNINTTIECGKDVVLFTSRKLKTGKDKIENLDIVNQVSNCLIKIVAKLKVQPKYILTKGGITSSDIATKALNVQRAKVLGQVIKGVPVWQLGTETSFPHTPYIIFPGNVGNERSLYEVITKLK